MKKVNRKNLPKWTKCLSVAEIRHLRDDMDMLNLASMERNAEHQERERKLWMETSDSIFGGCWDCLTISRKLKEAGVLK